METHHHRVCKQCQFQFIMVVEGNSSWMEMIDVSETETALMMLQLRVDMALTAITELLLSHLHIEIHSLKMVIIYLYEYEGAFDNLLKKMGRHRSLERHCH